MKSGVELGAVSLLPGRDELLIGRVVEVGLVLAERDHPDRDLAEPLELGVLGEVARPDQAHAGVPHAEIGIGLEHRRGMVAGRHEDVEAVR